MKLTRVDSCSTILMAIAHVNCQRIWNTNRNLVEVVAFIASLTFIIIFKHLAPGNEISYTFLRLDNFHRVTDAQHSQLHLTAALPLLPRHAATVLSAGAAAPA